MLVPGLDAGPMQQAPAEMNPADLANLPNNLKGIVENLGITLPGGGDGALGGVIGGIFKSNESNAEAGVPGLKNIPGLGWLFKNRAITKQNTELLVFITPRILTNDS